MQGRLDASGDQSDVAQNVARKNKQLLLYREVNIDFSLSKLLLPQSAHVTRKISACIAPTVSSVAIIDQE